MAKINAIDRALDVLLLLYDKNREMGVSEIARELELYKSTVHRTLETLEARSFICKNEQDKYWLGIKVFALGAVAGNTIPLKNLIQPYAKELSKRFNEVVNVSILDETSEDMPRTILVVKEVPQGNSLVTVNPPLGASSEAHYSAVGKCILAHTPVDILNRYNCEELPVYTDNTIGSWEGLLDALKGVRKEGYAIDNEDYEIGLTCIAAPILDQRGRALAAISLSGPSQRMQNHDFKVLIKELKKVAEEVSGFIR